MPFSSSGWASTSYNKQCFTHRIIQKQHCEQCLDDISERLLSVQIENRDALYVIERYGLFDKTLIYFDPPYTHETRVAKNTYLREVDNNFHAKAAHILRKSKGYVVVSGYACPLYTELYEAHGWTRVDKEAQTNSGGKRIESLWLSPRTVDALNLPKQGRLFNDWPRAPGLAVVCGGGERDNDLTF